MAAWAVASLFFAAAIQLAAADGPGVLPVSGQSMIPGQSNLAGQTALPTNGFNLNQLTTAATLNDLNALFAQGTPEKLNINQEGFSKAAGVIDLQHQDPTVPGNINQVVNSLTRDHINLALNPTPPGVPGAPVNVNQNTTSIATGLINTKFDLGPPGVPAAPQNYNQQIKAIADGSIDLKLPANSGPVNIQQISTAIAQGAINSQGAGPPGGDSKPVAGAPPTIGRRMLASS